MHRYQEEECAHGRHGHVHDYGRDVRESSSLFAGLVERSVGPMTDRFIRL